MRLAIFRKLWFNSGITMEQHSRELGWAFNQGKNKGWNECMKSQMGFRGDYLPTIVKAWDEFNDRDKPLHIRQAEEILRNE